MPLFFSLQIEIIQKDSKITNDINLDKYSLVSDAKAVKRTERKFNDNSLLSMFFKSDTSGSDTVLDKTMLNIFTIAILCHMFI